MRTSDFYYHLPPELIAQHPADPRDASRLLVYERDSGNVTHDQFYNLPNYLKEGDVLVALGLHSYYRVVLALHLLQSRASMSLLLAVVVALTLQTRLQEC